MNETRSKPGSVRTLVRNLRKQAEQAAQAPSSASIEVHIRGWDRMPEETKDALVKMFTTLADRASKGLPLLGVVQSDAEAAKIDTRHPFRPNKKYPWFCAHCGYAPHDTVMHKPNLEGSGA